MIEERGIRLDIDLEDEPDKDSEVFYNDDQQLNRDVSVAALQAFTDRHDLDVNVLDAFGGTGIRGLRYRREVSGLEAVTVNDINPSAADNVRRNMELNGLSDIEVTEQDANLLMTDRRKRYEYIDIDPFGSPADYADSAARCISHEGVVGVTATDLGTLCGSYRKTCKRRYASWSLNTSYCHEIGLRVLLKFLFETFARFDKVFRPKVVFAQKHYYRVLGEVQESKKGVNRSLDQVGYLRHCDDCGYRSLEEEPVHGDCPECGSHLHLLGPLWIGKLGRRDFLADVRDDLDEREYDDAAELVEMLHGECLLKTPYYDTHQIAGSIGLPVPTKQELLDELHDIGYNAAPTHFSPMGIRTNAPIEDLKDVIRDLKGGE
ncbi:MAG: tRNA (guanine(10)-N(2))-dimethyltransferase [Candidatus Nanohaloarchaea archaeon]|nr:tRNA (guanine(10)-N(2))-dimethyltransferase [Candidatus Nanohaloarchaea archaeon]